ncbi:MAG: peptidylprolyl isomerase [Bacteroidaceae bacterium]|nr:peptidylprolyl isomerase [Bacteroidaceae bacterium]
MMKHILSYAALLLLCPAYMSAQTEDPIVMRVAGYDVTRSEFEYNYNKNNTDGVIDKKTVDEYAQLFVDYKLKVQAAKDARFDTITSFQKEFRTYRDQQIRPLLVPEGAEEAEVRKYYEAQKKRVGDSYLILPAHIFLPIKQQAKAEEQEKVHTRIDSIYNALQGGADFAELAKKHSEDRMTAARGGVIQWLGPKDFLPVLDSVAYTLRIGDVSKPVQSPVGWHIMKMMDTKWLEPYDTLAPLIRIQLAARGLKEYLERQAVDSLTKASGKSAELLMDELADKYAAKDNDLKYLIKEYYDGLLLFELMSNNVWQPAAADTVSLEKYFNKNKKKYQPTKEELKAGKAKVKEWTEVSSRVVADLQDERTKEYVKELRKRYKVEIFKKVLKTVNKH